MSNICFKFLIFFLGNNHPFFSSNFLIFSCVIYFADNGPGLGVEDPNLLFKPFVTKKDEGLGLGLYIVNEIISIHNGRIEVITDNDNIPSEYTGAKFKIELNME